MLFAILIKVSWFECNDIRIVVEIKQKSRTEPPPGNIQRAVQIEKVLDEPFLIMLSYLSCCMQCYSQFVAFSLETDSFGFRLWFVGVTQPQLQPQREARRSTAVQRVNALEDHDRSVCVSNVQRRTLTYLLLHGAREGAGHAAAVTARVSSYPRGSLNANSQKSNRATQ